MIKTLDKVEGFVNNSDRALDMLESIEHQILDEQVSRIIDRRLPSVPTLPVCNANDELWQKSAIDQVELRFGVQPSILCVTDVVPNEKEERDLHDVVREFNRQINRHAGKIAREAKTNFTDADSIFDYPHESQTEMCHVNVLGAYRLRDEWYLNVGITNEKKEKHLGEFKRLYLVEILRHGGGYGYMKLPERDANHRIRNDTTTIVVGHRSTAEPAVFKAVFLDDNIGVRRALSKAASYTQQTTEALSPSSLAILFFPLWMNLVPIAMLANVGTMKMILYALLSDVLTVLPLGIKGVELISIGSSEYVGSVVRMTSFRNGTRAEAAAAEVYVAQCHVKQNLVAIGGAFVAIALLFLVGGVLAEFIAKGYKERRRKKLYAAMMKYNSCRSSRTSMSSRRRTDSKDRGVSTHWGAERESYDQYDNEQHHLC